MIKTEMSISEFRERLLSVPETGKVRSYYEYRLGDGALKIEAIIEDEPSVIEKHAAVSVTRQCFGFGIYLLVSFIIICILFHEPLLNGEYDGDDTASIAALFVCILMPVFGLSAIIVGLYRRYIKGCKD